MGSLAADEAANGTSTWEKIASLKRQALWESIPEEWRIPTELLPASTEDDVSQWPETCGWFTDEELAITNSTASELIAQLTSGRLSAETATRAFCKRAAAAHQLVSEMHPSHNLEDVPKVTRDVAIDELFVGNVLRSGLANRKGERQPFQGEGDASGPPARAPDLVEGQLSPQGLGCDCRIRVARRRCRDVGFRLGAAPGKQWRDFLRQDEHADGHDDCRERQQRFWTNSESAQQTDDQRR